MSVASTLSYRHSRNTALPFVTASAPTSTNPQFVAGANILTSFKGYVERRAGFDTGFVGCLEPTPTTFTGAIQRVYGWRRWGSSFFLMLNEVTATASKVYKLQVGSDVSYVLIWTSSSTAIFDFVVSNNFVFFGNGVDMKKYDGTTVTNWGIAVGSISTGTSLYCGTGANAAGANPWIAPTGIQGPPDGSDTNVALTAPAHSFASSASLLATNYGFAIAATSTIVGLQLNLTGHQDLPPGIGSSLVGFTIYVTNGGVVIGTSKFTSLFSGTDITVTLGGSADMWGNALTPAIVNSSTFGISIVASVNNAFGGSPRVAHFNLDAAQLTVYSIGGPTVAVSGSAGTMAAVNGGYQYVFCYYNANTGHVSSPTPPSNATGNFAAKLNVGITLTASTDPQVTAIRLFRTTDGGGGVYFEVANSPYPNASGVVTDNTADAALSLITAPTFGFNDPPPPQSGFVWFANRIWGFSNNTVYFTDWEELNIGVAEESCVSGPAGNFWQFDSEVTALSVAQDGVIIFTAGSIFKIDGDSLDTFRRTTIAKGIGCRNRATIARLGAMTAFLANTNSIWTTDSNSLQEISKEIQPTLDGINHSQASMTFHIQGQNRWLVLFDVGHEQTLCYDTNTQQWMPPWTVLATACTSAETSPGNWDFLIGNTPSRKMLQLTPGIYLDNGATYSANLVTNPQPIVNEHLGAGSAYIDLYYPQNPGQIGYMEYFGADFNAILPSDILYEMDDDPGTTTYKSIVANQCDSPLKTNLQGINVKNMWYYLRKDTGRRISIQVVWNAANSNFKLYTMTVAYKVYR